MISVLIDPAGQFPNQQSKIRKIISSFLKKEKIDGVEISVKLVGRKEMRQLNKKYRGIEKPTTILTFSQLEGKEEKAFKEPLKSLTTLGDMVICLEEAKKQGQSLERLVIHGLKNLFKFDERPRLLSKISSPKNLRA